MPNGWRNWRFEDVAEFLKLNGFEINKPTRDSHFTWTRSDDKAAYTTLQNHAGKSIAPKTLRSCARLSKISDKEWIAYSKNKHSYKKNKKKSDR